VKAFIQSVVGFGWLSMACLVACHGKPKSDAAPALGASTGAPVASAPRALPSASAVAPAAHSAEPDTVSQASAAYDAGPPVLVDGKVDGAALRRRHIERLKQDHSAVTVLGGEGALELGRRICEAVVPQRAPNTPILIKPNICGFDGLKNVAKSGGDDGVTGRTTDPEFVRGVLQCLKARGHTRVTIAEGCGNSHRYWQDTIAVSGFEAMAKEEGVPLVAMDDDGVFDVQGDKPGKPLGIEGIQGTHVPTLLMPQILAETLEHGLFISVPKLKTHRYSIVSLGIKGMQGTVMRSDASPAYNQKWRMHAELKDYLHAQHEHDPEDRAAYVASLELFAERMVDVLEISLPDVVLVDGAPAMSGDGFQHLRQVPGKIAIGGTNPVFVDRVGAQYLGLWNNSDLAQQLGGHKTSPLIEVAARRYGLDLKSPPLTGDGASLIEQPHTPYLKAIAPFTLDGGHVIAPAPAPARPVAHAAHTTVAPLLDGKLDEVWSRAPRVTWDSDYAGKATAISTSARFLWQEGALFVLFELEGAGLDNTDRSRPTSTERSKLYEEDCVELFLAPDPKTRQHYFEIELGPFGHWFDIDVDHEHGKENPAWSSAVETRTLADAALHHAVIEASFRAPEVASALQAGAQLPLGLFRSEGKGERAYLAWSPPRTPKPNFHVPEAFGSLVLDP